MISWLDWWHFTHTCVCSVDSTGGISHTQDKTIFHTHMRRQYFTHTREDNISHTHDETIFHTHMTRQHFTHTCEDNISHAWEDNISHTWEDFTLSSHVCVKCHQSSHSFIEFNGWLRSMSDSSVFFLVIFFYFGNVKFLSRKWNYVLHFNTHKKITKSNHQQLIDFFMIRFLYFLMTVLKNM